MPLSPERKQAIEDEERTKFTRKKDDEDEAAYRAKVRADLESGGFVGSLKKQAAKSMKEMLHGL